jgi:hypothetical protein
LIEELSQVAELQQFLGGRWICQQVHQKEERDPVKRRRIGSSLRRSAGSFHNYDFSFMPCKRWPGIPHMKYKLPVVKSGITVCPV